MRTRYVNKVKKKQFFIDKIKNLYINFEKCLQVVSRARVRVYIYKQFRPLIGLNY